MPTFAIIVVGLVYKSPKLSIAITLSQSGFNIVLPVPFANKYRYSFVSPLSIKFLVSPSAASFVNSFALWLTLTPSFVTLTYLSKLMLLSGFISYA